MLDKKIVYFIEVVNEGSFSAASRKLLISQAAISQQITLLESELNVKLFDRDGYRPILTSAGRQFYQGDSHHFVCQKTGQWILQDLFH